MNNIDKQITDLEKQLALLKEQKKHLENKDVLNVKDDDMKITVYPYSDNESEKIFSTFNEMFDYISKKMKKNDIFAFDYYQDKEWISKNFDIIDENSKQKIMELLLTFDAYSFYTMELGVCNKKSQWKYGVFVESTFLKEYKDAIENKHLYSEGEYWTLMQKGKDWRLFF